MTFLTVFPEYTGTGTGFIAPGTISSNHNFYPIPTLAYSQPLDGDSAFGIAVYGNGGIGTSYDIFNPNTFSNGVFGSGVTGAELLQGFISAGYARRFGNISVGAAPFVTVQRIDIWGLTPLAGLSSDPTHVTNQGNNWAVGIGLRVGAQWNVAPGWRLAVAGATPAATTDFHSYRGLFADQGSFDAPANISAGIAWDALPTLTLLLDYKHIFYSDIASVGDSSRIAAPFPPPLGTSGGPGFGWHDIDIVAFGGEWRAAPGFTLRAGYSYNTNPIRSSDVVFNILAPAIVQHHLAAGFSYGVTDHSSFDVAAIYVPRNQLSGPVPAAFGGGTVNLSLWEFEITAGVSLKFDTSKPPLVAKY